MLDLDILLNPDDEEGNPDPNARREPKSIYSLDNKDIVRKNSQLEELHRSIQEALTHFVVSLPAPEQEFMSQQSTIPWLKDLVVIKAHVAEKPIVNAGDKDKEDDTTAVTTGENNTADLKIPEQEEIANLNQGGVNTAPKPTHSPSGESIKSLQIKGKSYQDQEALPELSITILGNLDDTIKDIDVNPIVNYAKKAKGVKDNPDPTLEDVKSFNKTPQANNSNLQGLIKKDTLSKEDPGVRNTSVAAKLIKECLAAFKEGAGQDSSWILPSTPSSLTVRKPKAVGVWDRCSAFSLVKTISSIKRNRRDFATFSDCVHFSMFEEFIKESDNLLHQVHLHREDTQS